MNIHLIINANLYILIHTKKSNVKKIEMRNALLEKYTNNQQ